MWSGLERKVSSSRTRWTFLQLLHWQYHHALTSLPGTHCASVLGWDVQALLVGGDRQVNQSVPQANVLLFSRLILPPWHCSVATTLRKER